MSELSRLAAVLLRSSKWLLVITLTLSLGAHWIFLQSVAWVGMVVNYSNNASLTEALNKTFDGRHPCKLCKFVQTGKATEKKQNTQEPTTTLDKFLPAGRPFVLYPPELESAQFSALTLASSCLAPPPTPPPERV